MLEMARGILVQVADLESLSLPEEVRGRLRIGAAVPVGDYVLPGEHAPMTVDKATLIAESKGEVLNHWADIMAASEEAGEEIVFALSEVIEALKKRHGKVYETPLQMKKEALKRGWRTVDDRVAVDGALSYVVASPAMGDELEKRVEEGDRRGTRAWLLERLKRLSEKMNGM